MNYHTLGERWRSPPSHIKTLGNEFIWNLSLGRKIKAPNIEISFFFSDDKMNVFIMLLYRQIEREDLAPVPNTLNNGCSPLIEANRVVCTLINS